jgi:hypothetical protein
VRRGTLERWYDFYNNAEEGFAEVARGETCLRSSTGSRCGGPLPRGGSGEPCWRAAAFDYQNPREVMDRDRRQQQPRRAAAPAHAACRAVGDRFKAPGRRRANGESRLLGLREYRQ